MNAKTLTHTGHALDVMPRHDDGTLCGHELTAHGKALDAGCSGCNDYVATCACGVQWTGVVRSSLEYRHGRHLRMVADPAGGEC